MTQTMKYDKNGIGYYTPQQVIAMAQERGLPARLVGGYSVMPMSTVEALGVTRDWRKYYPHDYQTGKACFSNLPTATNLGG